MTTTTNLIRKVTFSYLNGLEDYMGLSEEELWGSIADDFRGFDAAEIQKYVREWKNNLDDFIARGLGCVP